MRFRYVDDEGAVRELADLPALVQAVREGHVHRSTMLYDARTERWAIAREHDVYVAAMASPNPLTADDASPDRPSP